LVEGIAIIDQFIESCKATKLTEMEDFAYLMASYLGGCKSKTIDISEALLGVFLSMLDLIKTNLADFAKNNDTTFANYENIYFFFKEEYFAATGKDLSEPEEHHAADTVAQKAAEPASDEEILEMIEAVEIIERPRLSEKKEIRVDVSKLDNLINLVGELVIAQSILLYHPVLAKVDDNELERAIHHLQQISGDLQDVAMTTRMVPLNKTFTKMTRLVYDVAKKANKKVNFEAYGGETEVDRNIIEMIGDPLVHMIRNSIDHGLEHPEERLAVGKKETGLVALEARNESGEVCITVRDDGRGINRKNILKKAIQNGLVKSTDVLTDKEILGLIFEPGFSTAEKVTDISGRGVGMDVVKQNIDKLKGTIEVASIEGSGSVVTLRIPLTLAIIDGMLIRVANTSYMIPLLSVRESLKVENHTLTTTPNGEETILIRNNHIPIVRLYSLFNKKPDSTNLKDGILVICDTAGQLIALYVDEIIGQQQTVIKSLPGYLKNMSGVSGCAIIGNGEISLILDIKGLVSMKNKE
jgi:two-component system chemotaxis sensor kinase CheA